MNGLQAQNAHSYIQIKGDKQLPLSHYITLAALIFVILTYTYAFSNTRSSMVAIIFSGMIVSSIFTTSLPVLIFS